MKLAIPAAIVFAIGIYPGLAGYDGPPPPNPPPRARAHKPVAKPKAPMSIAIVLERLKQKLEHRADARVSPAADRADG